MVGDVIMGERMDLCELEGDMNLGLGLGLEMDVEP